MTTELSLNTQAMLLLTAPLIVGRSQSSVSPLTACEYNGLEQWLRERRRDPTDLLDTGANVALKDCRLGLDHERIERLLGRGFLLSQAVDRWRTRAIWVVSRADTDYPRCLKTRLGDHTPPVLYGCGDVTLLETGGLAVVGSRNVDDRLIEYTEGVGRLTAEARCTLVSGGARGVDQAAMCGALEAGGRVVGVLADGLEKAVMHREHRETLMDGRLTLICPYDPAAGFHVGRAMERNKLIYALSDAALVVSSDYEKGGTWTGAVEQLDRLKFVPVYVRTNDERNKGLDGLRKRGAQPWPNPRAPEVLEGILRGPPVVEGITLKQEILPLGVQEERMPSEHDRQVKATTSEAVPEIHVAVTPGPADELLDKVGDILKRECMDVPKTEAEVAEALNVSRPQARDWLKRLVAGGVLEKLPRRPARYRAVSSASPLFNHAALEKR